MIIIIVHKDNINLIYQQVKQNFTPQLSGAKKLKYKV